MKKRLGIVGGGQLGAFLAQAARDLEVETTILTKAPEGIVTRYADSILDASLGELEAVQALIDASDVVTFELEDVPGPTLKLLAEQTQAQVHPDPAVMLLLQNKAHQKAWLFEHNFPTTPFLRFDEGIDPDAAVDRFGPDFVIKTQRGGYDGLGVKLVRDSQVPAEYRNVPVIAEEAVKDFVEIAVLVARNAEGQCVPYPLFESEFDAGGNVLRRVVCPAMSESEIAENATELACNVVDALGGVGVFAVEYFLTATELLINEIAPRVHNVGHLTIEASNASQFEQHVRAVMGIPFPAELTVTPAVMDNLLYEDAIAESCRNEVTLDTAEGVFVHWYGKGGPRTLRKMGHLTTISDTVDNARGLADQALAQLRSE